MFGILSRLGSIGLRSSDLGGSQYGEMSQPSYGTPFDFAVQPSYQLRGYSPFYVGEGDIYSQIMSQPQPRNPSQIYGTGIYRGYDPDLYRRSLDRAIAAAAAQGASGGQGLIDLTGGGGPGEGSIGGPSANPADTIALGQALQGYGKSLGGMAPGGLLAGLLGSGMVNAGINALGEMEANQAAQEAAFNSMAAVAADLAAAAAAGGAPGGMGLGPGASAAEMAAINAAIEAAAAENAASPGGTTDAASPGGTDYGSDGFGNYAKGGKVTMRGLLVDETLPGPDDGYAALQAGEYVIKKSTTKKLGDKKLQALNEGRASIKMRKE